MNIFNRIKRHIEVKYATKSSPNFISYLRRKGLCVGSNCYFQAPWTITVDVSRPYLVEIGDNCIFLKNFTLLTHDNITKVFGNIYHDFLPSSGKVFIGNNVYFARNCTVLKGVTIGDNCIIGYGSTVTRDIPSNSVAVGSPAKVICTIEEYYRKRKEQSLKEAFEHARIIYKRTGRRPTMEEMWEEFPFWMDGGLDDSRLRFSVAYQTRGFAEFYKKNHKAPYKSFDDFIDAALNQ